MVEIIIIVLILVALVAVLVPLLSNYVQSAQEEQEMAEAHSIMIALQIMLTNDSQNVGDQRWFRHSADELRFEACLPEEYQDCEVYLLLFPAAIAQLNDMIALRLSDYEQHRELLFPAPVEWQNAPTSNVGGKIVVRDGKIVAMKVCPSGDAENGKVYVYEQGEVFIQK